jgi:hypothetical protein
MEVVAAWCCALQTPQVLYCEFLHTWQYIIRNFTHLQISSLVEKCLRKYLYDNSEKACVFFDKDNKICSQHESRPYNCRIYGITPDEEFVPRYEKLKVIYPDIKPQCNLVSTVNGEAVSKKDIDNWWIELRSIELYSWYQTAIYILMKCMALIGHIMITYYCIFLAKQV